MSGMLMSEEESKDSEPTGEKPKDSQPEKPKKQLSEEEKYLRLVKEVHLLARKLQDLSPNHRTAAYWEQLEEDTGELLLVPLGT